MDMRANIIFFGKHVLNKFIYGTQKSKRNIYFILTLERGLKMATSMMTEKIEEFVFGSSDSGVTEIAQGAIVT